MRRSRFSPNVEVFENRLVLSDVTPSIGATVVDPSTSSCETSTAASCNTTEGAQTSAETGWSAFISDESFTIPYFCDVPTDEPSSLFDPVYYANG